MKYLFSGCYGKAEEIDDSGGNFGVFVQELFVSWINARQKAGFSSYDTVKYIFRWMETDQYGFCYDIEKDAAQVFDKEEFRLFRKHFEDQFNLAFAPFKDHDLKYTHDYPYDARKPLNILKDIYTTKNDVKSYLALC